MCPGITDGQPVDATNSNAAWLAKNGDDTTIGVLGLNNSAPSSGVPITNTQGAINVLISAAGGDQYTPATAYGPLPASTISGLTHEQALGVIARFFQGATGHNHDGTDGNGPQIDAVLSLAPSGGVGVSGDVLLVEGTKITLSQAGQGITINSSPYSLQEVLTVGNVASAGIDFRGGAFAGLGYGELNEVGFPPAAPAIGYLWVAASAGDHLYVKNSASAIRRVDTSVAASGQSAIYGDVVIAPSGGIQLGQSGNTITVYAPTGGGVTSAAVSGSSPIAGAVTFSASGGTVLAESGQNITIYSPTGGGGVTSFAASGSSALTGAVTLSASGAVVLTQSGQNVQIYAPSGGSSFNSQIYLSIGNGHGSSKTRIRRFTNNDINTGTDMTYADSSTLGMSITINTTGTYVISYVDTAGGAGYYGISVNASAADQNINITSLDFSRGLRLVAQSNSSGGGDCLSITLRLNAGDVVRAHDDGSMSANLVYNSNFNIVRVG